MQEETPPSVVLIDGDCGLCRATEAWVKKRDTKGRFTFHTLESSEGAKWLTRAGLPVETRDTMVLVEPGDRAFVRSTAMLRIMRRLGRGWPMLYGFIAVPRPLRDGVYRLVARNRRRIRVRGQAVCQIPNGNTRDR